jgi:hypothetical protein
MGRFYRKGALVGVWAVGPNHDGGGHGGKRANVGCETM